MTTAHEELIEAVAKAIYGEDYSATLYEAREYSSEPNGASAWCEVEEMQKSARAAIATIREALKEPTPEMVSKGREECRLSPGNSLGLSHAPVAVPVYRAMISASALAGGE